MTKKIKIWLKKNLWGIDKLAHYSRMTRSFNVTPVSYSFILHVISSKFIHFTEFITFTVLRGKILNSPISPNSWFLRGRKKSPEFTNFTEFMIFTGSREEPWIHQFHRIHDFYGVEGRARNSPISPNSPFLEGRGESLEFTNFTEFTIFRGPRREPRIHRFHRIHHFYRAEGRA